MLLSTHRCVGSSSKYCMCHPPLAKPPSVSSSAPPGACAVPSRLRNSFTITWRISVPPVVVCRFRRECTEDVIGRSAGPVRLPVDLIAAQLDACRADVVPLVRLLQPVLRVGSRD